MAYTGECHPEIYVRYPRSEPRKPGQLTDEQIEEYFEKGFVVVRDFFSPEELQPSRDAISVLVDDLAEKLFAAGKIKNKHADAGLFQRLALITKEFPDANVIFVKTGILPKAMCQLAQHERLLNLLEDFLGPDIAFGTIWNIRSKTPGSAAFEVPWHQDSSYLDNRSYQVQMMTAWIPFLDANEQNGTLQMVRGGHKNAKIARHEACEPPSFYLRLPEKEMERDLGCNLSEEVETVDVPFGSFILFNNFIPHRSLPNRSNDIRWSVDLRWHRADAPNCFFDLKDTLQVRSAADPSLAPDWDTYNTQDRTKKQLEFMGADADELTTAIQGPWMERWAAVSA